MRLAAARRLSYRASQTSPTVNCILTEVVCTRTRDCSDLVSEASPHFLVQLNQLLRQSSQGATTAFNNSWRAKETVQLANGWLVTAETGSSEILVALSGAQTRAM